jgi:hypothetical protein
MAGVEQSARIDKRSAFCVTADQICSLRILPSLTKSRRVTCQWKPLRQWRALRQHVTVAFPIIKAPNPLRCVY